MTATRVAIVGAGVAGLACAGALAAGGLAVTVLDKGRRPGGRASTRQTPLPFDHGAQVLSARREPFARKLEELERAGVLAPFAPAIAGDEDPGRSKWTGVPGIGALCTFMARNLDVRCGVQVEGLRRTAGGWTLHAAGGAELVTADVVVVAVPAPQAAALVREADAELSLALAQVEMDPCWALLLGLGEPSRAPAEAARAPTAALAWVCRDDRRSAAPTPAGPVVERWVVHASAETSRALLEAPREEVRDRLVGELGAWTGRAPRSVLHAEAHRWRFARAVRAIGVPCLGDGTSGLVACGDFCLGDRVEDAYASGLAAAEHVLGSPERRRVTGSS